MLNFVNNQPPVAGNLAVTRNPGLGFTLLISDLLTNASDPDGDALALLSFSSSNTNGIGNVTTDGTSIFYAPGTNGNVTDAFTYTVRDVRAYRVGDTVRSATGTVVVNVAPAIPGQVQSISMPGSTVQLTFAGSVGYPYAVDRSTNLVDWVTLLLTNMPPAGLFQFADDFSDLGGPPSAAFYRLRYAP